jgi:hypothetical protein
VPTGKEKAGIFLGNLVLLLYLTMINLVVFYFDQFSTILLASIQFGLFLGLNSYNQRFVIPAEVAAAARSHADAG